MFNQGATEKKLDWMYKGAGSLVDREEYLLGRSVDKSLEQLNAEERQKQLGTGAPPKNHVEHECIPPSIRDYKQQQELAEQVDLQAKLQEDPLLMIKKREEETRKQFLQNPVQLRKLQKALSKQEKKSRRRKKEYLNEILLQKLKLLQKNSNDLEENIIDKKAKREKDLDIILMHKFNALKGRLTEDDLKDIMEGKFTDSEDSDSGSDEKSATRESKEKRAKNDKKKRKKKADRMPSDDSDTSSSNTQNRDKMKSKCKRRRKDSTSSSSYSDSAPERNSNKQSGEKKASKLVSNSIKHRHERSRPPHPTKSKKRNASPSPSASSGTSCRSSVERHERNERRRSASRSRSKHSKRRVGAERSPVRSNDCGDNRDRPKIQNWGLVRSDGSQMALSRRSRSTSRERRERREARRAKAKRTETAPQRTQNRSKRLTSAERQLLLQEMRANAVEQGVERAKNIKMYRDEDAKEALQRDFDESFARKEYIKSAGTSTVESRIKANLNNIQRGKSDMDSHFSRRH